MASSSIYASSVFAEFCSIYPKNLVNLNDAIIPFTLSNESWTLVSGDYVDQTYAVFAKVVQNDMVAVKMYAADHEMEIMPSELNTSVTVDGELIVDHKDGFLVDDRPKYFVFK